VAQAKVGRAQTPARLREPVHEPELRWLGVESFPAFVGEPGGVVYPPTQRAGHLAPSLRTPHKRPGVRGPLQPEMAGGKIGLPLSQGGILQLYHFQVGSCVMELNKISVSHVSEPDHGLIACASAAREALKDSSRGRPRLAADQVPSTRLSAVGGEGLGALAEDLQVPAVGEDAVAAAAGQLADDAQTGQHLHAVGRGGPGRAGTAAGLGEGEQRPLPEGSQHPQRRAAGAAGTLDAGGIGGEKGHQPAGGLDGLGGHPLDARFLDVSEDHWFYPWADRAVAEGLLPPAAYPERKLRPEEPITRAEAALAVARLPGVKARPDLSPRFPETANSDLGPSGLSKFVEIW